MKSPISIILPTLNEKGNIGGLIEKISEILHPNEIIVVDDNSVDGTINEIRLEQKKYRNLIVIINNPPLGLTKSLQKGIILSKSENVAWMDTDWSHPPETLLKMFQSLSHYDLIIASWLMKGGRDLRNDKSAVIRSVIINYICRLLFDHSVTAYTSGFAVAKKKIFNDFSFQDDYGEYFISLLVHCMKKGYKLKEIPFTCLSRKFSVSKTNSTFPQFLKKGIKYLSAIIRLKLTG